jgi:hypothetical protein
MRLRLLNFVESILNSFVSYRNTSLVPATLPLIKYCLVSIPPITEHVCLDLNKHTPLKSDVNKNTNQNCFHLITFPYRLAVYCVWALTIDKGKAIPVTGHENPCGGAVEYLHRDPASRKRRRNGTKKRPRHSLSG